MTLSRGLMRWDRRLGVIERWVGIRPGLDDLDQEIAQVRREKEAAIDTQEFETAAALRDKEKELLSLRASRRRSGQRLPETARRWPRSSGG